MSLPQLLPTLQATLHATVLSLWKDCIGHQKKCPFIELSLLESTIAFITQCLIPCFFVLTTRLFLKRGSSYQEITVLTSFFLVPSASQDLNYQVKEAST